MVTRSVSRVVLVLSVLVSSQASSVGGPSASGRRVPASAAVSDDVAGRTTAGYYVGPVAPLVVLRPFSPPQHEYGPGHLGVDLAAAPGAPVHAAGAGRVQFAGQVAGRGVVVVAHPDGVSTEYEPVTATVRTGESVRGGELIGRVAGRHRGCATTCLHWGARRDGQYLNPLELLRPLGPVRLLPWPRGS